MKIKKIWRKNIHQCRYPAMIKRDGKKVWK
jgi:hypothetical protein